MRVIGLMSGTSADAVDAALVEWPDDGAAQPFQLLASLEAPLGAGHRERVHAFAAAEVAGPDALRELARLHVELADHFADAALAVVEAAGLEPSDIDAIGSHGQTVAHHPEHRASLQIGCPSRIALRTGIRTVADFRAADLAAGGEGAPLAPFFHWAAMSRPGEARGVLNLGGIANLTCLPADGSPEGVVAFDVGPANSLLDGVVRALSGGREQMDAGGAGALRGSIDAALLERLLDDDYLRRAPPKSTGRERYGRAEADALAAAWSGREPDDLLATLVAFTAEAVARACREHAPEPLERLLVGGGGAANPASMRALAERIPGVRVEPFDAVGVPADAAEAMAFSLLARNALIGEVNHLPRTTGAGRAVVLGVATPALPAAR